jgi:hypothetical protein
MTQPSTTRCRVLRWLLVMTALAGLGLWQGAHCRDAVTAGPGTTALVTAGPVTTVADTATAGHRHHPPNAGTARPGATHRGDGPVAELDACDVAPVTAIGAVGGPRLSLPNGVRTTSSTERAKTTTRTRLVPAVALATIGVCRT